MARKKMPPFAALKEACAPLQPQTEAEIKIACLDWLTRLHYRPIRIQTGNLVVPAGQHRRRCIQCAPIGTADCLIVLPPNGYALFVEFKSEKGKQSPEQIEFAEWCASVGAGYRLIRSLDDLIAAMREEVENGKVRRPT